jgi:hypothetical protein
VHELATMDPRDEIERALYRFSWCFNFEGAIGIGELFTDDAEVHFDNGLGRGPEAIETEIARRRAVHPEHEHPWHVLTNVMVRETSPARALVRSRFSFYVRWDGDRPDELRTHGYYDDVFVPDGDRWRLKERRITRFMGAK